MAEKNLTKSIRHAELLELAAALGHVRLLDASLKLGVSEQTVRRDVKELDKLGKVKRTHGGFAFLGNMNNAVFTQRQTSQQAEKAKIARKIAEKIPDGATVFLDTGSTCEAVAEALLVRKNLRVVTYGIRGAMIFSERQDFTIAIPGGIVRNFDGAIVGIESDNFVEQFKFDYAIIAVSGLDEHGSLTDDDAFEVRCVKAAMRNAKQTILALTTEKIGIRALMTLAEFDKIHHVVVDGASHPLIENLAEKNNVGVIFTGAPN